LLLLPAVLAALMLVFQVGLLQHGRGVVEAAAADGLGAAQLEGGTEASGEAAARSTLDLAGGLTGVTVDVDRTSKVARVTVSAEVQGPMGFGRRVAAVVEGPIERWYDEADR